MLDCSPMSNQGESFNYSQSEWQLWCVSLCLAYKYKHTCLKVNWMASYFRSSSTFISSMIDLYPLSNSSCRFINFSFCSEKFTNWSNAFLLTWLYFFNSVLHCSSFRNNYKKKKGISQFTHKETAMHFQIKTSKTYLLETQCLVLFKRFLGQWPKLTNFLHTLFFLLQQHALSIGHLFQFFSIMIYSIHVFLFHIFPAFHTLLKFLNSSFCFVNGIVQIYSGEENKNQPII